MGACIWLAQNRTNSPENVADEVIYYGCKLGNTKPLDRQEDKTVRFFYYKVFISEISSSPCLNQQQIGMLIQNTRKKTNWIGIGKKKLQYIFIFSYFQSFFLRKIISFSKIDITRIIVNN